MVFISATLPTRGNNSFTPYILLREAIFLVGVERLLLEFVPQDWIPKLCCPPAYQAKIWHSHLFVDLEQTLQSSATHRDGARDDDLLRRRAAGVDNSTALDG